MYFKKLSLQGFKSFADPVTIEFDKGITCVVGPNGSGKSNISDALRWVLGEQSPKMLRGGKMDEVIFAGTDKRQPKGMAEVSLVIDNTDHSLPVDFDEVSITRRMYRSGESEYLINGSQCRLRDIRELIMDTGIGVDGYSIIGQGKISEIISGRPESRREIFEEAAGIVKYRTKKAEAEKKLAATSANLERVSDIINELGQRIEPLRDASDRAKSYIELNERYRENEINVILKNIEQAEKQAELLGKDEGVLDSQIADCDERRLSIDQDIAAGKQHLDELDAQDMEVREFIMKFNSELDELRNSVKLDNEKINALKANSRIYKDEMIRITEKMSREQSELRQIQQQTESVIKQGEKISADINEVSSQYDRAAAELREKNEMFNSDRDRLYEVSMQASAKGAEISGLRQIRATLEERLAAVSESGIDLTAEPSYEIDLKAAERKLESIKQSLHAEKIRLEGFLKERDEIAEKRAAAEKDHSMALASLNDALTRKEMLEQLENSYEGYNYAVKLVMGEPHLKGLYGTVGDLINVPRGYEVAIDTALGSRMQNIVCRDDESASSAIRVLKTRRAGRLTFLPVESMRVSQRRSESGLEDEAGFIGIAADCVTYEPEYAKIMEYLLGGIAVVKTLNDALRISKKYGGLRYVTLDGEFINPSGAITGGSQKNSSAGILERKNRLNEVQKAVYQLEKDKKSAESIMNNAAANEEILTKSVSESEERCRAAEIEIINAQNEIASLKEKTDSYNESVVRARREFERISTELDKNAVRISELEKEKTAAEASAEALRQSAEDIAVQNSDRRKKMDELSEKLTSLKIKMESVRNDMAASASLAEGCERRINAFKEEYAMKETAEREAVSGQEALESQIRHSTDEIKVRESAFTVHNEKLEIIKQAKIKADADIEKLRTDRESVDRNLYSLRASKSEITSKTDALQNRIDTWKGRVAEEFEITYAEALGVKKTVFDLGEGQKESRRLRIALRNLGDVNMSAIEEYAQVKERYEFLTAQKKDLDEAIRSLNRIIDDTDTKIKTAFRTSFAAVNMNFKSIFSELFGGGRAELHMENSDDPLEAVIEIAAQPPGKKLQNMNLLSGGEKTMTAIALMFAVLKTKPTPFCILDEVEAALDEANIDRFAKYLENFEGIQFVLVTHQKVTMEHADVLYGITMPEKGISNILSLRLSDAADWEEKQ